jgi:hypothetical protein
VDDKLAAEEQPQLQLSQDRPAMPDRLRQALLAAETGGNPDPFELQEALAWQPPAQSLESLLLKAKETKESMVGSLRADVVSTEPNSRYWQGSPDEFATPWGALRIDEMAEHSKIGPVLSSLLDFEALREVVDTPKIWTQNPIWVGSAPGGRREEPLCVLGARIYSSDPTHGGCFSFMEGKITVSKDKRTRGQVHFTCNKEGCPGNDSEGIAYRQLTLQAWFAKQCQLHMQKHGREELAYLSFLTSVPRTLGQIWMAHQCVARKAAIDEAKNSSALQQGVKAALLAGEPGMTTPGSISVSASSAAKKSKSSSGKASAVTQVPGQQKLSFSSRVDSKKRSLVSPEAGECSRAPPAQGTPAAQANQQPAQSSKKKKKPKKSKKKDKTV